MELSKFILSWDQHTLNHANTFCQVGTIRKSPVLILLLIQSAFRVGQKTKPSASKYFDDGELNYDVLFNKWKPDQIQ